MSTLNGKLKVKQNGQYVVIHPETESSLITDFASAVRNTIPITTRANSTAYKVGDCVFVKGLPSWAYLECTQTGTTAASAPSTITSTVTLDTAITDGSSKWVVRQYGVPSNPALRSIIKNNIAADSLLYGTGANTFAITALSSLARTLIGKTTAADMRSVLGAIDSSQVPTLVTRGVRYSITENGYICFGQLFGGLILQWICEGLGLDNSQINFPISFSNKVCSCTECNKKKINISLPSLRIAAFSLDVMSKVQDIKKSSLTFASEAGTQRLRDVINKGITEEDILNGSREAFLGGWDKVKLYFMLGLPTETDQDLYGIAELAEKISEVYFDTVPKEKRNGRVMINASASYFVPKPFTPFQWAPMILPEEFTRRAYYVKDSFLQQRNKKSLKFTYHDANISILEGVLARGDRRLSAVIYDVYKQGAIFDAWTEYFDIHRYMDAFKRHNIDILFYTTRERSLDEVFPWDHIDAGVTKAYLAREWEQAQKGVVTKNCRSQCMGCGSAV